VWLAQAASPGVYDVGIPFPDTGLARLEVLIRHDDSIELLSVDSLHVGALAAAASAGPGGGLPLPAWIALGVVALALLAFGLRAGLRARRAVAMGLLVLLSVAVPGSRDARAHEGESHGAEPAAPPPGTAGGAAVPAGTRHVAKEAQFEIGLLTATARLEAIATSRRVFGTLVADASASAEIIAPQTGRYVGRRALQVGDRVARGQTLGAILVVDELPVRSPIAGTLAAVTAVPGQTVVAGQSLAHVVDLTRLRLELPLYGDALAAGLRARSATIRLPGLPDESFAARVQGLAPTAGASGGSAVPLLLSVANPRGVLRPGMVVEAWLESPDVAEFVTVPVGALLTTEQGPAVFVKVGPEAFQFRAVTIGPRSGDRIGIARGVSAGERVVVAGGAPLLATAEAPR
jgi:multidrug efflux pump subunit AcrA (membrane-fusion protein)